MATMADDGERMDVAVPSKRARLDLSKENEDESYSINSSCNSRSSDIISGINGESASTSDSGFNELTPPRSGSEDELTNGGNSQSNLFENYNFHEINEAKVSNSNEDLQNTDNEDDDACSVGSTTSNLSGFSNLSSFSGKEWKPCAGPMSWVQQQMTKGANPRTVLTHILGSTYTIPDGVSDFMLWHIIINMLSEPPRRERLRHINTLEDVIRLIKVCRKVIVLTGAGVSVSCGIPDFRSKDGIYARLAVDFPNLPDPQAMFDIHYFRKDPRPFFKFAKEIYPGQFTPSLCHRFIRRLEQQNRLLRNYTQNIDTLEQVAGISHVIQCHGSFATATCQRCSLKVDADVIKKDIFDQHIPKCSICTKKLEDRINFPTSSKSHSGTPLSHHVNNEEHSNITKDTTRNDKPSSSRENWTPHRHSHSSAPPRDPIMKPDIVFFGEGLPDEFHDKMAEDKDECDLLIVIGSSLKVRPVALIPSSISPNVPQILINREPLGHLTFDVELLGDCDIIVSELCRRLGVNWTDLSIDKPLSEIQELPPRLDTTSKCNNNDDTTLHDNLQNAPHPKDESDIEALRACWAPKVKESIAARLPEGTFLYNGNHRYVFPGAEVYIDPDEEDNDSQSSDSDSEFEDIDADLTPRNEETSIDTPDKVSFHSRLSSIESMSEVETSSTSLISGRRRSSQALSEDVDSLLSTSSCDPANNTPDHPIEGNWSSSEPLSNIHHFQSASAASAEDWTSLSASLDASSMTTQLDEDHYDLLAESHLDKSDIKDKIHKTKCLV